MSKEEIIKALKIPSKKLTLVIIVTFSLVISIHSVRSFFYFSESFQIAAEIGTSPVRFDKSFEQAMEENPVEFFLSFSKFNFGIFYFLIASVFLFILIQALWQIHWRKKILKMVNELEDPSTHN